jgi:hypothetical protein
MRKPLSFISLLILSAFYSSAQTSLNFKAGQEIKAERSMYSKVFFKETGVHQAVISGSPVHYEKNGAWEDINTNIVVTNEGSQNESNLIKSYFPSISTNSAKIKLSVASKEILIHTEKKLVLLNDQNELKVLSDVQNNCSAFVNANQVRYNSIYEGISDEFRVLNGEIKNNFILDHPAAWLNGINKGYFGFEETLELPQDWKIVSLSKNTSSFTSSGLTIVDEKGKPALNIPAPVFFDNYGLNSDGTSVVEGIFLISEKNGVWTITTLAPVEWLKNPSTKYPVSLDPTVVIPGNTGGWQSPNNWVDNPGFVFVGVCCGNQTHRGWIKFDVSGIPTTSCVTNVEVQVTMATENSVNPELVLINDVTGAFGPYGAIVPAAYNDFGNGFYTSFTISGMGTYGYYSLGPSANALLQAQIPGGWFQVAFQFNNEPSIDWKNINATSSNLRVTYIAPPCTLPIELLSFDAKCYNEKVNLKWTTASQKNNDQFIIEKSVDGANFEVAGKVKGAGTTEQQLDYSFTDIESAKGTTYYSLKQSDVNGESRRVHMVAVTCNSSSELKLSPNPNVGVFTIEGADQDAEVIVTDVTGQLHLQTRIYSERTQIDLRAKENGIYFLQIISKNGSTSRKVILNK